MFLHDAVEMFDVYITPITWLHLSVCVNKYLRKTNQFVASLGIPSLVSRIIQTSKTSIMQEKHCQKIDEAFPLQQILYVIPPLLELPPSELSKA